MIENGLFWLALGGLIVAAVGATGAKVLHDFSGRELEEYCAGRRRRKLFNEILARHEQAGRAAESLQILGGVLAAVCGAFWLLDAGRTLEPPAWRALLLVCALAALVLLALIIWIPAAIAEVLSAPLLYHTWPFWRVASRLLRPLTTGVGVCERLLRRLAGRLYEEADEEEAFEDEIRTMVRAGLHDGLLEPDAREMIESVIDLADTDVSDIMTPRSDVDAMDADLSWSEMLEFVIRVRRTRIPVYEETLDNVIGVLYVKDLLPELARKDRASPKPIRDLARKPWFVPKTNAVDDMLQEFLRTRNHLAIVVEEYDAVAGVVTIEDVLEEIVGEIVDEFDADVAPETRQIDDSTVEAIGKTHLDDLNERFAIGLPEPDDCDTIGGFVMRQLGRIPKAGESLVYNNVRITVLESTRRRVERVRLTRLAAPEPERA